MADNKQDRPQTDDPGNRRMKEGSQKVAGQDVPATPPMPPTSNQQKEDKRHD